MSAFIKALCIAGIAALLAAPVAAAAGSFDADDGATPLPKVPLRLLRASAEPASGVQWRLVVLGSGGRLAGHGISVDWTGPQQPLHLHFDRASGFEALGSLAEPGQGKAAMLQVLARF
jgi:hypothetical protein